MLFRERRRERKKINRKDRLKISAENTSVAQAATRASQAILSRQQGKDNIKIDNWIYPAIIGSALSFSQ